ncbi:hypothetical protein Q3G72_032604 [Acer saccharum]|nr:hypothetical protein Q3G72_032604 [Acer saccharum]
MYSDNFVSNEKEVFYTYDVRDSSVLSRVVLSPSDIRKGGSGCLLWFNDLIDIRHIEGGQDLYVRVAASELGNIESRRQPSGKKKVNVIIIVASIISGMGALVLAWIMYMRKTKLKNEGHLGEIKLRQKRIKLLEHMDICLLMGRETEDFATLITIIIFLDMHGDSGMKKGQ